LAGSLSQPLFQPALNLRSISGTSARNRGDAKGLAAIAVDSASVPPALELRSRTLIELSPLYLSVQFRGEGGPPTSSSAMPSAFD
jgi:hypothetical protein